MSRIQLVGSCGDATGGTYARRSASVRLRVPFSVSSEVVWGNVLDALGSIGDAARQRKHSWRIIARLYDW